LGGNAKKISAVVGDALVDYNLAVRVDVVGRMFGVEEG
jgi:hypothetical protein